MSAPNHQTSATSRWRDQGEKKTLKIAGSDAIEERTSNPRRTRPGQEEASAKIETWSTEQAPQTKKAGKPSEERRLRGQRRHAKKRIEALAENRATEERVMEQEQRDLSMGRQEVALSM